MILMSIHGIVSGCFQEILHFHICSPNSLYKKMCVRIHSDSNRIQSDLNRIHSDLNRIKSDLNRIESAWNRIEPHWNRIESDRIEYDLI